MFSNHHPWLRELCTGGKCGSWDGSWVTHGHPCSARSTRSSVYPQRGCLSSPMSVQWERRPRPPWVRILLLQQPNSWHCWQELHVAPMGSWAQMLPESSRTMSGGPLPLRTMGQEASLSGVERAQSERLWSQFLTLDQPCWSFYNGGSQLFHYLVLGLHFLSKHIVNQPLPTPHKHYIHVSMSGHSDFDSFFHKFMSPFHGYLFVPLCHAWRTPGCCALPVTVPFSSAFPAALIQVNWQRGVCLSAGMGGRKWNKCMKGNIEHLMYCNYQMILSRLWWVPVGFIAILTVFFPTALLNE